MDKILYQNYKYIKPKHLKGSENHMHMAKPLGINQGNKNLLERIYAKKMSQKSMQILQKEKV